MSDAILKAKHKPWAHLIFRRYLAYSLRRHFSGFSWDGALEKDDHRALLVVGNHFSWWDGFFLYWLNEQFLQRRFHLMMLERELKPRPFFRYLGAFSMKKGARSMLQTMEYAAELLKDPDNIVVIFPQGKLESQHEEYLHWQKGIMRIMDAVESGFHLVFSVALIDYWDQPKPAVKMYLRQVEPEGRSFEVIEQEYNAFYKACKQKQSETKR